MFWAPADGNALLAWQVFEQSGQELCRPFMLNSFVQRAHYLNFKMGRVMGLWSNLLPGNRTGVDEQMWYLMFWVPLS